MTRSPEAIAMLAMLPMGAVLLCAVAADCRSRRIPNELIAWGLLSAALTQGLLPEGAHPLHADPAGTPGLLSGLLALVLMLALAGGLWRLHMFGAGDAKLLSALAAHGPPAQVMPLLLLTSLLGGVLALAWWAARRTDRMPYSVAIAAAATLMGGSETVHRLFQMEMP